MKVSTSLLLAIAGLISLALAQMKYNGVDYVSWTTGDYASPLSDRSLAESKLSGINYLSIVVTYYQDTIDSTVIGFVPGRSNNDTEIVHLIKMAHIAELKVALKPHVDLSNDASHWRGEIGQSFDADRWTSWFNSYSSYMLHIATLAAQNNVEMIVVGTELSLTEAQEMHWRDVIKAIKGVFKGLLVYGSNWDIGNGGHSVNWWDVIDFIGIDAYFPIATHASPTVSELLQGWQPWFKFIQALQQKWQRPVMFPEIGYASTVDTAQTPWESHGKLDLQAQANAYEAFFTTYYNNSWFVGAFLWAWGTNPMEGGSCDIGMTPHNKPAEDVMKKWYVGSSTAKQLKGTNALSIFQNGNLGSGWENWSWSGTVNLKATDNTYNGAQFSLSANMQGWGAVSLHYSNMNTAPYTHVQLAVLGSPSIGDNLYVGFSGPSGQIEGDGLPVSRYTDCTLPRSWTLVNVPLSDLGASNTTINAINLKNEQSTGPAQYWLDAISLTN